MQRDVCVDAFDAHPYLAACKGTSLAYVKLQLQALQREASSSLQGQLTTENAEIAAANRQLQQQVCSCRSRAL